MSDDGPPDPRLDPARSPGVGSGNRDVSEIDVGRNVTLGTATPGELTATDTEPVADATVAELCDALAHADAVDRRRAAVALSRRPPSDEAVEPLSMAARRDRDADVRQFAVEALVTHADGRTVEAIEAATEDEDPWVRAEAIVALDNVDREANASLIEAALDDGHPAVRRNAMISLYKLRGSGALATLLSGLDDPGERVREWAAELLGGIDDDRARRALSETAAADDSAIVRATAERALGHEVGAPPEGRRTNSGGANHRQTPANPGGGTGADDLNEPPDL